MIEASGRGAKNLSGASGLILAKNSYEVTITTGRTLAFLVPTPIQ